MACEFLGLGSRKKIIENLIMTRQQTESSAMIQFGSKGSNLNLFYHRLLFHLISATIKYPTGNFPISQIYYLSLGNNVIQCNLRFLCSM
jgi:hypothetical protein